MATADQYAAWIIQNQAKRGTPDFDTVARAYEQAKAEESQSVKSAGFSVKDLALAAGQGLAGGVQSLTDLAGAGNVVSKKLGDIQQSAAEAMTPERQAEIARRAEIKKKAEGDTWEEIKATLGGLAEAPLQTGIQALASSAPIIAGSFLAPPAAAAATAGRAGMAAKALSAAKNPATGIGALMGLGGQKGQDYETVKQELLARGVPEAEAERLAQRAAEYSLQNLPRQAASTAVGGLEGALGIERALGSLGKAASKVEGAPRGLTEPTWKQAISKNVLEEALPEALQASTGQVGTNVALTQAGIPTDLLQGVAAQAIHDALVGGGLGAATSPAKMSQLRKEFVQDEMAAQREFDKKQREAIAAEQAKLDATKAQFGVGKEPLALPAPAPTVIKEEEVPPLQNPIGNLTPDELGPEVTRYINKYRRDNGLPFLQAYSVEDVKDAMTAVNPEGEKAALDSILTAKTGFSGTEKYTAENVMDAAVEKNVATGTKGFNDFLARTTGVNNLEEMSQPQLYAAFKALKEMPENTTGQETVLPEGSNASRFKQAQYDNAVKLVGMTFNERGGKPLSVDTIIQEIKEATNLETDRDARALLDTAVKNGDLTEDKQTVYRTYNPQNDQLVSTYPTRAAADAAAKKRGLNVREATLTQVAPKAAPVVPAKPRAGLPAGYDITERTFKEGEAPTGFEITPEGKGKPLTTLTNEAEVQGKIERLTGLRQQEAAKTLGDVHRYEANVKKGRGQLEAMEARGETGTEAYAKAQAQQERVEKVLGQRIARLYDLIEEFNAPLKAKPVGKKDVTRTGYTITKEGKETGTFPTREAAEESILADLSDEALDALVSDKKFGGLQNRAIAEQNRRKSKPAEGKKVSEVLGKIEAEKPIPETPESKKKVEDLRKTLDKFGLGDVALQIVKAIENQADGSYAAKVIQLAVDARNPIRTMRHEALHALKELGFFTPQQWKALERMAKDQWIDKYLKSKKATLDDGTVVSRYEAYQKLGLSEADILEEAIADAFGDFDSSKAPAGMLTALLNKMRNFFDALSNYLSGRGFQTYKDIFGQVEAGKLKPSKATPAQGKLSIKPADWKATPEVTAEAEDYFEENGIMPYTSEGQLDVPVAVSGTKFSIKGAYTESQGQERVKKKRDGSEVVVPAKFNDPITGLPMNADGTVTLYYPTTNEIARNIATAKKLTAHSPTANRIYLTNESSANVVAETPGMIDQPLGGANVMFKVDPSMIEIAQTYENGRKDFFIPIAEGEVFEKKMKMTKLFTVNAPRSKGLHPDRSLAQVTEGIEKATEAWKNANAQERAKLFSDAKDVLRDEHNIGTLFGANAKLEKTNIGDYGLLFKGKKVMSTGLGFASAQKISDKRMESTCPKSAICEALCLGETSGQNELYGGEGPFRSGPRLSQYLKTEAFVVNPEAFATSLIRQIENFRNAAKKLGYYPAIRLNVTSDFPAKMFKPVIEMFPDVQFYDYTKLETKPIAENHHLTYSSTGASQEVNGNIIFNKESNWDRVVDKILSAGKNVAMAFTSRNDMPKFVKDERTGQTFEVWNGDEYDARFLDPVRNDGKGWIIGLTNKDRTTAPEDAASRHNGFFLDYNAEDGDTLVIKDQKRLAEEFQGKAPTGKVFPMKKFSLSEAPDTPEFKAWFKDSKIVTKPIAKKVNGELIISPPEAKVMYHGTARDITEFRPKQANAIFVTASPSFAEGFSDASVDYMNREYWNSLDSDEQNKMVSDAIDAAKKAKEISASTAKLLKSRIDPDYGFSWSSIPSAIEEQVIKAVRDKLPTGPNVMPVYVSAQNPFDYKDSDQVNALERQLQKSYNFSDDPDLMYLVKMGDWKTIESQVVQDALKKLGHDGFYVSEGGQKNLAVYSPSQIKSATGNVGTYDATNPDIRYSLRDATDNFDSKEIEQAATQGYKSREKLVSMPITDFLKLAEFGHVKSKQDDANERVKSGTKFTTLPYLEIYERTDDGLRVTGHEGRHRARALLAEGKETMPVILRGDIRWSEQADPDKFDYVEKWPERIYAQKGAVNEYASIPMPVTREESVEDYQVKPLPTLKYSVRNVEDEVSKLPNGADLNASIDRLTTKREQKGFIERLLSVFTPDSVDSLRQQWLNRYERLSAYDKRLAEQMGGAVLLADSSAESAALMSDNANAIAAQACGMSGEGGIPVYQNGFTTIDTSVKGLMEILKPLAEVGDPRIYQTYQFWAGAKRGSRLTAEGRDHTYSPAELAYAKQLEAKYPMFKQVQEDWIKYNDGLVQYQIDTGVLSPERAEEYKKYADYIPFYRQFEGQDTLGPKIFQSISGVKPPKKLKGVKEGQEAPLADFLETLVRNTQAAVQAGMKNVAGQRAINVALQLKEASRLNEVTARPGTVTVLENGKPVSYEVADQLFVDAVKSLNLPELPFLSIFSAPANALRNLVTKDPGFMMANLLRDSLSAWVTSGQKMTPIAATISNFGKAIGGTDPAFLALKRAGVIGGYEFAQDVETSGSLLSSKLRKETGTQTGTEKALRPFNSLWEGLEKGTEASDAATRMAVYKSVMERTGNEAEAIYRAMEVMNFNRKGNLAVVRILTAAVPFLNARMQGLDVFYRAAFGKNASEDAAAIQKSFFIRGAMLTSLTAMYWFATHDDEEYKRQEQETRDNNWLFPAAGIRIPTPFEVGTLFKVIPERILEYSFGNDTGKDLSESMTRALISTFAFNPIPQTVLPLVEARTNYSFYTMRPIVGQGMEGVASEYQVGPNTTQIAQSVGKSIGVSPMKVDHIINGYTGTMGMYLVDAIDQILSINDASPKASKRFEQMPVIKRFAVDKEAKGTVTAYYDLKNSVDEVVRTMNLMERTAQGSEMGAYMKDNARLFGMRDYVSSVEKDMKQLREATVKIRSSSMSPDAKRDALRAITEAQNQLTGNIRTIKKLIDK